MDRYNLNYFSLFSFHILFFDLFIFNLIATSTNTSEDDGMCKLVYCGKGTCKSSNTSLLGFECECYSGWKKMETGPLTFLSCTIPNCTIDLGCGNVSPASPPTAPLPPPPLNISKPCNLIWCADGTCMPNGNAHTCQCNEGSANLLNDTQLPCFQQCYFGEDCHSLGFGTPSPSSGVLVY